MPRSNKNIPATISRQKSKPAEVRVPGWWNKEAKTAKGIAVCPRCHAVFYDKHWHAWAKALLSLPLSLKAREEVCRACLLSSAGKSTGYGYEGEVILAGLSGESLKQEVIRTAKNVARRALKRDPEDQIIKIEDLGKRVRITTSENRLAEAIGKEVDRAYKGGALKISFSKSDLPVRVYWTAKK